MRTAAARWFVSILGIICALISMSVAQDSLSTAMREKGGLYRWNTTLRSTPTKAFAEGERLVFDVGYSFITAGEAVMSVPKSDTVFGRPVYQVLFTVNSTKTFAWIYRVDDRYETLLDVQGMFPWHFSQRVREGSYKRDASAWFDQVKNIAYSGSKQYPIPPYVHDAVSAFYYVRTLDYSQSKIGDRLMLQNFFKDTTYSLAVKFLGRQRIDVDAGTFNCIIVEPMMKEGGLFKSEGRVLIWLTDDERKIPVKVSTKVVIGSIEAELREYSGINGPIGAKVR
ncbi:MAG TPA: DUF3108 domain-containing protein [Bacteroidota bacterium]|nr:DUF3108 domain-containing protein [Bacteroidota bacterium]